MPSKKVATTSKPDKTSGSGFLINRDGYVVTNNHVDKECRTIFVASATVLARNSSMDLALLQTSLKSSKPARFRMSDTINLGESVMAAGFPLKNVIADQLNVTKGSVSSLAGVGNNPEMVQISAPIQPGNSGGPLLDSKGSVIGVVVSKLNLLWTIKNVGVIPENINFAIKVSTVKRFISENGSEYSIDEHTEHLSSTEQASAAKTFTVAIECN